MRTMYNDVNIQLMTRDSSFDNQRNALYLELATCIRATRSKGDFTRDDLQRQFLAQQSVVVLEQCCDHSKQCRNNVVMLCCPKNRRGESSHVILP